MNKSVTIPILGEAQPLRIFIDSIDHVQPSGNTCIIHLKSGKSLEYIYSFAHLQDLLSEAQK